MYLGIGARRGVREEEVIDAIEQALREIGRPSADIKAIASSTLKENEQGLIDAADRLGFKIRFYPAEVLNSCEVPSDSQAQRFGLKGVCEPAALVLSKKKHLLLKKKVYGRITIAIAE